MDIDELRAYRVLCDTMHFGRASQRLHMSPSTLSRLVGRLEEEAGIALFERNNRSVRLTDAGQRFRHFADESVSRWEALQGELHSSGAALHGELSFYCSVTASYSVLPELLRPFIEAHPAVRIRFETGNPEYATERVTGGDVDLAVAPEPAVVPGSIVSHRVLQSPMVLIASKGNANWCSGKAIDWESTPVIMPAEGVARGICESWFQQKNIAPAEFGRVGGNEAIISLVALGCGVGFVPEIVLERSHLKSSVRVVPLSSPIAPLGVAIVTARRSLNSPIVSAFWNSIVG